jgi:hypothetical protein
MCIIYLPRSYFRKIGKTGAKKETRAIYGYESDAARCIIRIVSEVVNGKFNLLGELD